MGITDHLITSVELSGCLPRITYADHLFLTGSCFAEHMERKLVRYKYNVSGNPFGILYNPVALAKSFIRINELRHYTDEDLVMHENLFHSMDHHGSFSGSDKTIVLKKINDSIDSAHAHLQKSRFVFVSLGTSKVYRYKQTGEIAGNNHKIPTAHFEPYSLSLEECFMSLEQMLQTIKQLSPEAKVIWTVSPIRHLKDGLVENQRSKSTLILAIEKMVHLQDDSIYFPAYEIMIDQLRDYRFYARDMKHPSEVAIDIIWELFCKTYLDQGEADHHGAMEKIMKAKEHRFLHNNKSAIRAFAETQLRNIDHFLLMFPEMNWKDERQYFFHLIEPD